MKRERSDLQTALARTRRREDAAVYSLCPSTSLLGREKIVLWACCYILSMQGLPSVAF
jgi:hypothetical protein